MGRRTSWRSRVAMGAGLTVAGLGAATVLFHFTHLGPARWHMPIGTAAGFVLAGASLVACSQHRRAVTRALAGVVVVGAVVALAQHLRVGMGSAPGVSPALPTASSALCLVFAALALVIGHRQPATAWSLGIVVLALATLGLSGRWLQLHATFVDLMPPLSALGCALLGLGLTFGIRLRTTARADLGARYTPFAAGATCLLATLLFWQSLVVHQRGELQRVVEMTAVASLAELSAFVTSVARALDHIADEWNAAGRLPAVQWRYQSRLVLERLGGPRSVEWIDDAYDVVYVVRPPKALSPFPGAAGDPAAPLTSDAQRALAVARASRAAVATPTFDAGERQVAFRLAVPLFRGGAPDGFVSALFLVDEMLDDLLATRLHDYVITVYEGDTQIYGARGSGGVAPCSWCRPYTLDLPGARSWTFRILPSAELRETIETSFPEMILFSGILISILLTAMLQFLARERRTARDLARANRSLHDEVASRRTAEQEIRTLATELEQRVRDRTTELATSNAALRSENALRQRAQSTLETANKNLRHFASFVSHELRQPLATMALWAELLETNPDVGLNERGHGYLKQLRASIDRMTGFLEAQLRLARVTYTQPTFDDDVEVGALVREVVGDGTLGLHAAGATVEIGDVPSVRADSGQLRQLFRNLLENAIKYRRPGVPLFIRVEGRVSERDGTRHCELRVSDNGEGFAETDAEKIFDLFEQLPGRKSAGKGSGVGLAICRRIVEHHGGTIRAEGRPGDGATFIIDLPLDRCEGKDDDPRPEILRP
jgi:signal transduction histidine kinase